MSCGPIGNSDESELVARRDQRFYLDVNNPAPCTGNITRWRVCYYGPGSVHEDGLYWATYAVYRRIGVDSDARHERVSNIFTAIRTVERFLQGAIIDGLISNSGFNCYTDTRGVGDVPVTVQAGDIIGACVFDPDDIRMLATRLPLHVVGEASGESLLEMGADECTREIIPSNIQLSQLTTSASQRLHLYADIGKKRDLATNKLF